MEELSRDDKREFMENLPEIKANERFCFDCHPQVPCFNQCCAELTLPLTPYDIMRLCRHLVMPSQEFLTTYTDMQIIEETGFAMHTLKMNREPGEPCPFVSPVGCQVYENRPSACRAYPLGRGTKLTAEGVAERFFLVHEEHCHGFDEGSQRTPAEWFANQGLAPYNNSNDQYMRLMSLVQASGKPLDQRLQAMSRLCLFHLASFRQMIEKMRIFAHLELDANRKAMIMEDSLEGDEACLAFAIDWMELVIFGQAEHLKRK